MGWFEDLSCGEPLESLADVSERAWCLLGPGQLPNGGCFIVDATDRGNIQVKGYYDGETGDAFDCAQAASPVESLANCDEEALPELLANLRRGDPAVHIIGSLDGRSGQLTIRQEKGNYLRISNWDRITSDAPLFKGALLRTLPQCGCGGSLGAPKLFVSFAEMSAYHFCAFYLPHA